MSARRAIAGLAFGVGLAAFAGVAAVAVARSNEPLVVPLTIHFSRFEPATAD